ncbi:uncharacterized protein LOC128322537 isoform X2 [Hemicordylus capensis]|nr:uncharacterized protein LOC128322537 isoform X2 [Hemicordylus capensis]XP_053099941.1 uncharacterized protein LOC128322537 isoform X2 [Hemicordylus capensis]XP_053099942.1 uncharacterized protein LOC128322537 isoform X2 [Hemicordylus capensis]
MRQAIMKSTGGSHPWPWQPWFYVSAISQEMIPCRITNSAKETEPREAEKWDLKDKEKLRYRMVDRYWSNWLVGYMVYMGVLLQKEPPRGASMEYLDIIYHAYSEYSGPTWAHYNEAFGHEPGLELPWDCYHKQLWLRIMGPNQLGGGEFSESGHLIVKFAAAPARGLMPGSVGQFTSLGGNLHAVHVVFGMPAPFVEAHTPSTPVRGAAGPILAQKMGLLLGKGETPLRKRGPSPIRLGPLLQLLQHYPVVQDMGCLGEGFQ